MRTILYLLRHGATEANLAQPPRLQGCRQDWPLARLGLRQAERTRDFLAARTLDACYCSPLLRAMQTASIIAAPHEVSPLVHQGLVEADVGQWEGLDWETIRHQDGERYHKFLANPAVHGFPGGETYADVYRRASATLEELWQRHHGQAILVVSHHIVNRTYLAGLLGLPMEQACLVSVDNCSISVAVRIDNQTTIQTLNTTFHLQGLAA